MKSYFLNARSFTSKNGKACYVIVIANLQGDVSEFFVPKDLYNKVSSKFSPFDFVEISLQISRGRPMLIDVSHVEDSE